MSPHSKKLNPQQSCSLFFLSSGSLSISQIAKRIRHSEEIRVWRHQQVMDALSQQADSLSTHLAPVLCTSSPLNILVSADRELYPSSPPPHKSRRSEADTRETESGTLELGLVPYSRV